MSEYWDLACVTCGGHYGVVMHWNHGGERLAQIAKVLPAIATLARAVAALDEAIDLELRIGHPEWQHGLLAYAIAHDGHDVRAASEYGVYLGECGYARGGERAGGLTSACRRPEGHDGDCNPASSTPGPMWPVPEEAP